MEATSTMFFLKVRDVADRLSMSVPAIWRLIYTGVLPFVRIGKSVRIRPEDLEAFIEARLQRRKPGVPAQYPPDLEKRESLRR